MKKVLFIDRDGTLIIEPPGEQIDSLEKLEFYPGVFTWLGKIAHELDFEFVMVTNQDGLGTDSFPEETFWPAHNKLMLSLQNESIVFSEVLIDKSFPYENSKTRKPGIGLLEKYFGNGYDLENSFTIGDRITDVELARNLGAKAVLLNTALANEVEANNLQDTCQLQTNSWEMIYNHLAKHSRTSIVNRKTNETEVTVKVNLDGSGNSLIKTGLNFFDHMLEQIARHGNIDLEINANGDLHVDDHHVIEDTALVLGEAFVQALGSKRGIERYGFCLPMDDCLAQVAIDFGGRPWLVWNAVFTREKIGDMPTEMFMHFFKSFSDTAKCNLNIDAQGINEHHKIEAIFKAFAKAIKMAVKKEGTQLPSTKGLL